MTKHQPLKNLRTYWQENDINKRLGKFVLASTLIYLIPQTLAIISIAVLPSKSLASMVWVCMNLGFVLTGVLVYPAWAVSYFPAKHWYSKILIICIAAFYGLFLSICINLLSGLMIYWIIPESTAAHPAACSISP